MTELPHLLVKQIMTNTMVTCRPDTALEEVARMMSDAEVDAVVVVNDTGDLVGLISQFDLLRLFGQDLSRLRAETCSVKDLIVIGPEESAAAAAQRMLDKRIHRLIVIDKNDSGTMRARGVISVSDIIRRMWPSEFAF